MTFEELEMKYRNTIIVESSNFPKPSLIEYRDYLNSNPIDYPKGSQDQDIFRYIERKFYPRMKVDYENEMAFRS